MAPDNQPAADGYARAQRLLKLTAQLRRAGVVCTNSAGLNYLPTTTGPDQAVERRR
jgi:hypothetical protein